MTFKRTKRTKPDWYDKRDEAVRMYLQEKTGLKLRKFWITMHPSYKYYEVNFSVEMGEIDQVWHKMRLDVALALNPEPEQETVEVPVILTTTKKE